MKYHAILIDVAARDIRAVEYDSTSGLQALVGGFISIARSWPNGDTLYVDDEGLFKSKHGLFRISGLEQPLAGNGVLVGAETYDDEGEYTGTAPPGIGIEQVRGMVRFLDHEQARAWGRGNASEPASAFYALGPDGEITEGHVFAYHGNLFEEMPTPPLPKVGQRIRLLEMPHEPDPLPAGACGTVRDVVSVGKDTWQVEVAWDGGRKLCLAIPPDRWEPLA